MVATVQQSYSYSRRVEEGEEEGGARAGGAAAARLLGAGLEGGIGGGQ